MPKIDERIIEKTKWSMPCWEVDDKSFLSFGVMAKDHANLQFWLGTSVEDPKKRLEGTGKNMRHIKVFVDNDLDLSYISELVKDSIALYDGGHPRIP